MRKVKVAFVAPGQGVEDWTSGLRMLEENSKTERIYAQVLEATGVNIVDVCESEEPITDPAIVQPAALGIGVAKAEVLKERGIKPDYLIGISAGEFTVAAISKSLPVGRAAYISQQRGISQNEVAGGLGGAVTAMHKRPLDLNSLLQGLDGLAWPANFHAPDLTGFGYLKEGLPELMDRLREQGARAKELNLPFPPHGQILHTTQEKVAALLPKSTIFKRGAVKRANTKIISIRTAEAVQKARDVRRSLIWQTTEPTQFNRAVLYAIDNGVEDFFDLGPGDSCTKILGRIITTPNIRINPLN